MCVVAFLCVRIKKKYTSNNYPDDVVSLFLCFASPPTTSSTVFFPFSLLTLDIKKFFIFAFLRLLFTIHLGPFGLLKVAMERRNAWLSPQKGVVQKDDALFNTPLGFPVIFCFPRAVGR